MAAAAAAVCGRSTLNEMEPITELLQRVHAGDRDALNAVVGFVYDELKKLAAAHLRREGPAAASGQSALNTTALVHEAFIRLSDGRHPTYENRAHFYGIASRLMRQILVDAARARGTQKRNAAAEVPIAELAELGRQPDETLLAVDDALERLAQVDARKAQLIEMRFFGGMTAEESALALGLPVQTVRRGLRVAQAWLLKEMAAGQQAP